VSNVSDIIAYAPGERGWGNTPVVENTRRTTMLPNSPITCTRHVAGMPATTSKIGSLLNRSSRGTALD
jgi:hypothetical protein